MKVGVIAALRRELGPFASFGTEVGAGALRAASRRPPRRGPLCDGRVEVVAAECGVGKVAAATTAAALVAEGVELLLVVGSCGGLAAGRSEGAEVGDLVHAERAIQWDLAVREGRESVAHPEVVAVWRRVAGGALGTMLTADRPAVRWIERARRARALRLHEGGVAVADMETAAVAAVADRHGVPWAALRVVSDRRASPLRRLLGKSPGSFADHFERVAALPADTVERLLEGLIGVEAGHEGKSAG